ncbi:acyltransferase-domain-containing protein [Phanerochaete sordida]|uniref:Tafazzin family protein n=1 Tax=Phanerochaete sordida TaxID=48140 RepID=A0A9P3LIA8_9APHY|nr:acyltransferase-domain-containing protein [Phanerochaete sordida]
MQALCLHRIQPPPRHYSASRDVFGRYMSSIVSRLTLGAVGLTCKTFLNSGYCAAVTVNGFEHLQKALQDERRKGGRGVVTISNHISTLDDPLTWGILPWRWYFQQGMVRWSLGAADIIFTNPVFSAFFRQGQTLETFRGKGIYQPAVDTAIDNLNRGEWIHLFGEGKVHQPGHYPPKPQPSAESSATHVPDTNQLLHSPSKGKDPPLLLRFKWGLGRILMEAEQPPTIIPMWLTGFEKLMPEGRNWPYKFFPRRGVALSVNFGEPIPGDEVRRRLWEASERGGVSTLAAGSELTVGDPAQEERSVAKAGQRWLGDIVQHRMHEPSEDSKQKRIARLRSEITAVLQQEVEALGRRVLDAKS